MPSITWTKLIDTPNLIIEQDPTNTQNICITIAKTKEIKIPGIPTRLETSYAWIKIKDNQVNGRPEHIETLKAEINPHALPTHIRKIWENTPTLNKES